MTLRGRLCGGVSWQFAEGGVQDLNVQPLVKAGGEREGGKKKISTAHYLSELPYFTMTPTPRLISLG